MDIIRELLQLQIFVSANEVFLLLLLLLLFCSVHWLVCWLVVVCCCLPVLLSLLCSLATHIEPELDKLEGTRKYN